MSTETATAATAARSIQNPVLRGFNPDPSMLRVGADYYLATSTFEWYPGVRVHHSRDLVHWRTLGGVITDHRLLDLGGAGDSNGVWAPDLTYHEGRFHLVYSDVASFASGYWDPRNFHTSAPAAVPWAGAGCSAGSGGRRGRGGCDRAGSGDGVVRVSVGDGPGS